MGQGTLIATCTVSCLVFSSLTSFTSSRVTSQTASFGTLGTFLPDAAAELELVQLDPRFAEVHLGRLHPSLEPLHPRNLLPQLAHLLLVLTNLVARTAWTFSAGGVVEEDQRRDEDRSRENLVPNAHNASNRLGSRQKQARASGARNLDPTSQQQRVSSFGCRQDDISQTTRFDSNASRRELER